MLFAWMDDCFFFENSETNRAMNSALCDGELDGVTGISSWLEALKPTCPLAKPQVENLLKVSQAVVKDQWSNLFSVALPEIECESPKPPLYLSWLIHFAIYAHNRLGNLSEAKRIVDQQKSRWEQTATPALRWERDFDEFRMRLFKENYQEGMKGFLLLKETCRSLKLSNYTLFLYWMLFGSVSLLLGDLKNSDEAIVAQESIVDAHTSKYFFSSFCRRKLSHMIEKEQYLEAKEFAKERVVPLLQNMTSVVRLLTQQLLLRIEIVSGSEESIRIFWQNFHSEFASNTELMTLYFSLEDECEMHLKGVRFRKRKLSQINTDLRKLAEKGADISQFFLLLMKTRILTETGDLELARSAIVQARKIARDKGLVRHEIKALILSAEVDIGLGRRSSAFATLVSARQKAKAVKLVLQQLCCQFLLESLGTNSVASSWMVRLHASVGGVQVLLYLAKCYNLQIPRTLEFRTIKGTRDSVSSEIFLEEMPESAVFFFKEESRLGLLKAKVFSTRILSSGESELLEVFVDRGDKGLALAEVFSVLSPNKDFRLVHHGHIVKSALKKLRASLSPMGVPLVYKETKYLLDSSLPFFEITPKAGNLKSEIRLRPREVELLRLVESTGGHTTTELCAQLKVTRQTLHPMLQNLVRHKKIKQHKRGRSTYYTSMIKS